MPIKSNRLNIYLIKNNFRSYDSIVKLDTYDDIKKIDLGNIGRFYYIPSRKREPDWLRDFFNDNGDIDSREFKISTVRALFLVRVRINDSNKFFAIPFGGGRYLMKNNCYESRFGLMTTLNLLKNGTVRALDKRTLSTNPKLSREQISVEGQVKDFGFNFDNEIIQSITGQSNDREFGNTITGKGAFSITAKVDLSNVKEFLERCYLTFKQTNYRSDFDWIDKIKSISDSTLVDELNEKLVKDINRSTNTVWISVPELIDSFEISGFNFSNLVNTGLLSELTLNDYIASLDPNQTITLNDLFTNNISCWNNDMAIQYSWSVYECLNAEISLRNNKYCLINSQWYLINRAFATRVNSDFSKIRPFQINLPDFENIDTDEGAYNKRAANHLNALCLDQELIFHGGGRSKIEFCDIITKSGELIHIKRKEVSATLSHLFSQGHVAGELLLFDEVFRAKLRSILAHGYKSLSPSAKPDPSNYKIIYAIISKNITQQIPFFSKVTLNYHKKVLEGYGYTVYLNKIKNTQ
ncbi:MAG: TIGR04141 family sporadically distributed protein [Ignavibacteriaceae bacterium]|nr:TIGR04141 family sporadically distributed protein [Ignavibacteriaceae bacterium]